MHHGVYRQEPHCDDEQPRTPIEESFGQHDEDQHGDHGLVIGPDLPAEVDGPGVDGVQEARDEPNAGREEPSTEYVGQDDRACV